MQANIEHMVISIFICVAMTSLGIIWGVDADEEPDPDGLYGTGSTDAIEVLVFTLEDPTYEELAEKVRAQEKRIIRLELIIEPGKQKIVIRYILVSLLLLLVVVGIIIIFKLVGR